MKYGYARVSTEDQSLDSQMDALNAYGCDMILSEKVSGTITNRPVLSKLLKLLKPSDIVVIHRLDRLGRSMGQLVNLLTYFEKNMIGFVSLADSINTNSPTGKLLYHVLGSIAHFERDLIANRTKLALAAAKKRGVRLGRPKGISKRTKEKLIACQELIKQKVSIASACKQVGLSKPSYYKYAHLIKQRP